MSVLLAVMKASEHGFSDGDHLIMDDHEYSGEQVRNAIAAAPELLEALEKIVSEGDYTAPEGMKRIARAAIAKVTPSTEQGSPL